MLSDLVFIANDRVKNRFLLCHLVCISSRKFHQKGVPMQETVNKVFGLVSEHGYRAGTLDLNGEWESSFTSSALGDVGAKLVA